MAKAYQRVSQYFRLPYIQAQLDFVDVPCRSDIELYVDPFAISLQQDVWFAACHNLILDYFDELLGCIKRGRQHRAIELLSPLREPSETHFGLSKGHTKGRGIGPVQATQLYQRLSASRAVKTRRLRELADCELLIPHIASDKISDITINVIRRMLLEYTREQCVSLGIPLRPMPIPPMWDAKKRVWRSGFEDAPTVDDKLLLLVPKTAARYRLGMDSSEYYRMFVLEYLRAEHLSAGSSLVQTLQNGRKRVTKTDLKKKYPLSIDFLADFSDRHPQVLKKYKGKAKLRAQTAPSNVGIEQRQRSPQNFDPATMVAELRAIEPGTTQASSYHQWIFGALQALFYPQLWKPRKEEKINEGRKRIDVVFNNNASSGFFASLRNDHKIQCPYVPFECKNYTQDPKNPEIDQLLGRLDKRSGMFGVITCRSVNDKPKMVSRLRDAAQKDRGYIICLDDDDFISLLNNTDKIDVNQSLLDDKLRALIM